ncbi:MAG: RNA polymerase factor sigma-54 [Candidatus Neomarinimicrobiota bacterium]|nr:RNA polymerase factor sigma-54 [Candidatus Neomarinimicrobiota bacterium]
MAELKQKQSLSHSLSPQQILQAQVLQLNSMNLEQKVVDELESNPLLEQPESMEENETLESKDEVDYEDDPDEYEPGNIYSNNKNNQEIPIAEQLDFLQGLSQQLNEFNLSDQEQSIAEEIIWNLDENGYLAVDIVLISDRIGVSEANVEKILFMVQKLNPPGIGARNLQECLTLQLQGKNYDLHRNIINNHFDDFVNHKYDKILNSIKIEEAELKQIIEHIKKLNPYPGEGKIKSQNDTVIPDLIVSNESGKWKIIINDSWITGLSLNENYLGILEQKSVARDTKKFLKQKLDSATWLIKAIEKRQITLTAVMSEIINNQPDFFNGDISLLKPMKLKDIADKLKMDISTISRSTRNKYVDTPYGIFELKSFFSNKYNLASGDQVSTKLIKNLLKKLIDDEIKDEPLTDTDLANQLKLKGYPLARRTVAKYREELKLPAARLRRQIIN